MTQKHVVQNLLISLGCSDLFDKTRCHCCAWGTCRW